jgi:hypothetical protein
MVGADISFLPDEARDAKFSDNGIEKMRSSEDHGINFVIRLRFLITFE